MKTLIVLLFSLLTAGCASITQIQQQLAGPQPDATPSFTAMPMTPLQPQQWQSVRLGNNSAWYLFTQGKSHYASLALPLSETARKLHFKTYLDDSYLPDARVLIPSFTLLDAARQPIVTLRPERLEAMQSDLIGHQYFEGEVVIPPQTAFIVVHQVDQPTPALSARSSDGVVHAIPHAPTGKLELMLSQPYAAGYDFGTALIRDSVTVHSAQLADFFYIASVDGKAVADSRSSTLQANAGRGFDSAPVVEQRQASVNAATYTLVGRNAYAPAILAVTKPVYQVKGEIHTTLQAGRHYVVRGELGASYAAVWLEDEQDHRVVGNKIEIHGAGRRSLLSREAWMD